MLNRRQFAPILVTCLLSWALGACTARVDVGATGAAPAAATHLWLTVQEIWFAQGADALPESATGWIKRPLATPVTIDLANLDAGTIQALGAGLGLPGGTYLQVHLVAADADDPLLPAASNLGFAANLGISLTDSNGAVTTGPLEWSVPGNGVTFATHLDLPGTLAADLQPTSSTTATTAGSTTTAAVPASTSLALVMDAGRDVVTYAYGANTGYLLDPMTRMVDTAQSGGISGQLDLSALPGDHAPVYASAESLSADGSHHVLVLRTAVSADGSFTLYPLPVSAGATNLFDVVISCAGANPVIVQAIPVVAGPPATDTALQSGAIALTPAATVYADLLVAAPQIPAGARVNFNETVPAAGELPYIIDGSAVNPVTRHLPANAFALPAGSLQVGSYAGGGTISFSTLVPVQGAGAYLLSSEALYRSDALAPSPVQLDGTLAQPTLVLAPVPGFPAGVVGGTLNITISATAGQFDSGFVTIASGNRLVETADLSGVLAAGGGVVLVAGIPSGTVLGNGAGVPYQFAVRAWQSADAANSFVRVAGPNTVVMGGAGSGSVVIQLP